MKKLIPVTITFIVTTAFILFIINESERSDFLSSYSIFFVLIAYVIGKMIGQYRRTKKSTLKSIFYVLVTITSANSTIAADRFWVATTAGNWNNTANWSTTSGSAGGASVPGSSDVAIFDGALGSTGNCTIDTTVSVSGFTISSGYTGIISQGTNPFTIGATGASLSDGTFAGGSASISISGPFTISGTTFTNTSGTMTVASGVTFTLSAGFFLHNNGTVTFSTANNTIASNLTFYNINLTNSSAGIFTIGAGKTMTVMGTLTIAGTNNITINTGTLEAQGNVSITNIGIGGGGTATLLIDGTGNQTLTGSGTIAGGELPNVTINKVSGTLFLAGIISTIGDWTYIRGTIDEGTSTVAFTTDLIITGSHSLNNVTFNAESFDDYFIDTGTTLTVLGTLTIQGVAVSINTGTIAAQGNITITSTHTNGGGSGTVLINGTGNQTLTGSGTIAGGELPNVTINKVSGTLFLAGIISTIGDWTYIRGTIDEGTSTVAFTTDLIITGSHSLNNVTFNAESFDDYFIDTGTTLTVLGTLTIQGVAVRINTGTIAAQGNITITSTHTNGGGSGTVLINGTGNQTLTGSGTIAGGELPNVTINKVSGTLFLAGIISTIGDWTYIRGTIDEGTSTVAFTTDLIITGSHSLNNVTFNAESFDDYFIDTGTTLTVLGTLTIQGVAVRINTGTIAAQGNITITSTHTNGGGSGTVLINGTGNQTLTGNSIAGGGGLPNVTINKSSGILTLDNTISILGNWFYINGTVDASANTSVVYMQGNGMIIDGEGASGTMSFYDLTLGDANTRTLLGNITISNVLSLGTGKINLNGHTCTMTLNSTGAITRSSGYMISESTDNSGKISWNIGSTVSSYIFPFATSGGTYIPLTFELTAGDAAYVTISTYPTVLNNTPFPTTPNNVTNLYNIGGTDNSANTIDRFWQIDKTGGGSTATITYTYAQAEVTGGVVGNEALLQAHRYDTTKNIWDDALSGQTANGTTNTVIETGVTTFSPRTLALSSSPLPIELLEFMAIQNDNNVDLYWTTATEINNEYFIIERTTDGINYQVIGIVDGAGNSIQEIHYYSIDDNPLPNTSYYRLKQVDFDGKYEYSDLVAITYNQKKMNFNVYPNPSNGRFSLSYYDDNEQVCSIEIYNILGEKIYFSKDYQPTINLSNEPNGMYFVYLNCNSVSITKKIVLEKP